ncbi:MAG: hypothetical protein ABJA81_07735 [Nocardioidaceae bacterium]
MSSLTRRDVLRAGFAAAALGTAGTWMVPGPAYSATETGVAGLAYDATEAPFVAYTPDSFFRSRVANAVVDQPRTAAFQSFMKSHPDQRACSYPRINGIGGNVWGTAYAMGSTSDPIWTLTGKLPAPCASLSTQGFHAPEWFGAMLTGTSDSPFCVIDLASGFTVFATKARLVGERAVSVASAGITYHSSNGLHRKNPLSNDNRNLTSRGRISDAMVIREDLVSYGVAKDTDLGHVLHMFLVETRSSDGACHPMIGAEGGKYGFGAEGERIAIAPTVDVTKRGLSPEALVIARTLQNYGCYFGDNSGSQSCLKAEQETADRPVWNGRLSRDSLAGLTWDDFVVIQRGR